MAIFAGTWVDDNAHPWDPDAKVLQTWPGGGSVSVTRRALVNHPARAPFIAATRYIADRWHNVLTQPNRDSWDTDAIDGPSRRGSLDRTPCNGYIALNAFDFIQLYADPPSYVLPALTYAENFTTAAVTAVDVPNQTVTFSVDMHPLLPFRDYTRLATYQIHPERILHANPWKHTRLIDFTAPPIVPDPPYVATVPLAWPVAPGDTIRLYWRGRVGSWWKYHADDTFAA